MRFCDGDYRDYMNYSLKQRSHQIGYAYNTPVSVPFCPKCHSYPCSCDDNIVTYLLGATANYNAVEEGFKPKDDIG